MLARLHARLVVLELRVRRSAKTRRGRQVLHDLAIAAAAALAVIKGAHTVDLGVLEAAGVVGVKVLLRLVLPVPAPTTEGPA